MEKHCGKVLGLNECVARVRIEWWFALFRRGHHALLEESKQIIYGYQAAIIKI